MEIVIVPKGEELMIKDKETNTPLTNVYVGAGWDQADGGKPVDVDLVAACLIGGKLTAGGTGRLVYFNDRTEPGVTLSEDNRTGAGDGDDESLVIDLSKVEPEVTEIAIGVMAYSAGVSLSQVNNIHFRIVNGTTATDPQVMSVSMDSAKLGDTVLHAATLKRGSEGWTIENVGQFYARGNQSDAVKGFANLFA